MTDCQPDGRDWTERWYRVMLLGYPAPYRERHGGELIGTLLEAYPSRRLPSLRESAGLLDAGLVTRLRTRLDPVPAWAAGLRLGVLLLALMQAGSQLAVQWSWLMQLAPVLIVVSLLLGRMGAAAVLAAVQGAVVTSQAWVVNMGTAYFGEEMFSSAVVGVQARSGGGDCWIWPGVLETWVIAVGAAVLAVTGRTRGPLRRRSWWWLTISLLQAAFTACTRALEPTWPQPGHQHITAPAALTALSVLPVVAAVGFLLFALRATVAIGDSRWTIAAGVYLVPTGILAAALAVTEPSAVLTLDSTLPAVLLAAACAVALLRGTRPRADQRP
ncbi:hypothetical protein ACFO3J_12750 [Streptomyces polygonati]|uniref:Uncharacterized protein n=1 Tax=Streptomyces polygonati TaxID=1617087 RepID=A0ABV8HJX0_9ACTN